MSIQTMKKKIANNSMGISISGRSPGGSWVSRGICNNKNLQPINTNNNGFSINGGHRNIGGVGKSWLFSKNFTPYKGVYPKGNGGSYGKYYNNGNVFLIDEVYTRGDEYLYIKPSTLTTKGMLELKYGKVWNGQYPCNIVSPEGNNNIQNNTNGLYTHSLMSANMCATNINEIPVKKSSTTKLYENFGRCKSACNASVKPLHTPYDNSSYTTIIQKKCAYPEDWQKPIPGPKNGNSLNAIDLNNSSTTTNAINTKCNLI
jgi:hypothetical protein